MMVGQWEAGGMMVGRWEAGGMMVSNKMESNRKN